MSRSPMFRIVALRWRVMVLIAAASLPALGSRPAVGRAEEAEVRAADNAKLPIEFHEVPLAARSN